MKNKDLFGLLQTINNLGDVKGKAFAYAIMKNKEKIEKEIDLFKKLQKEPHPEYVNYDNERNLLCIMNSKKDEYQNPIVIKNPDGTSRYDIEDMNKFQVEFKELSEKYDYVITDMEQAQKEYIEFMEKDSTITLNKVKLSDLPEDVSLNFLEQIKWMVD